MSGRRLSVVGRSRGASAGTGVWNGRRPSTVTSSPGAHNPPLGSAKARTSGQESCKGAKPDQQKSRILVLEFFLCVRNTLITCYAPTVWTNFKLTGPAGSPQGSTGVHRATGWSSAAAGAAPHSCCRRTVAETAGPPRGRAGRDGRQWGRPAGDKKCRADAKLSEPSHSLLGTAARACGRSPVSRLCPLRLLHHRAPHGLWVPA